MKKSIFLMIYAFLMFLISLNVSGQVRDAEAWKKYRSEYESQFPVVDYNAAEPKTVEEIALRKAKGKRYDNQDFVSRIPHPKDWETTLSDYAPPRPTDIHTLPSKIVVIGEVLNSQAYLSNDKSGVYSEFSIRVEEVIKTNNLDKVTESNLITADRMGGFVRYPNGQKVLYSISGGMLRIGRRYVLFLSNNDQSPNYYLAKGYELTSIGALWMDGRKKYEGTDEAIFKKSISEEIDKFLKELPTN
jgi:hypothetical protein